MFNATGFHEWLLRYGRSQSTADTYVATAGKAFEFDDPLARLRDPKLSPKYRALIKASLRSYSKFTNDGELADRLDLTKTPAPLRRRSKKILSPEQWKALRQEVATAEYLDYPMRAQIGMMLTRGFRRGDILRLYRDEVHEALDTGMLNYEAKGGRRIEFRVSDIWRPHLETFAEYEEWEQVYQLLTAGTSSAAGRAVDRGLKQCAENTGLEPEDVHPHLLRKTYATRFYERCRDPAKLKDHMQWANIQTAMLYVQASDAAELDTIAEGMFDD